MLVPASILLFGELPPIRAIAVSLEVHRQDVLLLRPSGDTLRAIASDAMPLVVAEARGAADLPGPTPRCRSEHRARWPMCIPHHAEDETRQSDHYRDGHQSLLAPELLTC